jgi:hypothetical protein
MAKQRPVQPSDPAARPGGILCPYCGHVSMNPRRCEACSGHFDPLSRQASQNAMGPWFIRDTANPFRPGCSYDTLRELIRRKKIHRNTVIRGPSTRQFWSFAGRTPSVANMLGICHNCQADVDAAAFACQACGAAFSPDTDRQHLGLAPVHLLPGQATPEMIAATTAADRKENGGNGPTQDDGDRGSNTGAWIVGGGAAGIVIALCTAAVIWALRMPGPEKIVAAQAPPAQALPAPEQTAQADKQAPPAIVQVEPPQEPAEAQLEVADAQPPDPPDPGTLLAELERSDIDLATLRQHVQALRDNGSMSKNAAADWLAMLERAQHQELLRRLP